MECYVGGEQGIWDRAYSGGSKNAIGMLAKMDVWLPGLQYASAGSAKWVTVSWSGFDIQRYVSWFGQGGYLGRESGGRTVAGKVARVGALGAGTGCDGEERDGKDVGEVHFVGGREGDLILGRKWAILFRW